MLRTRQSQRCATAVESSIKHTLLPLAGRGKLTPPHTSQHASNYSTPLSKGYIGRCELDSPLGTWKDSKACCSVLTSSLLLHLKLDVKLRWRAILLPVIATCSAPDASGPRHPLYVLSGSR